MAGSLGPLLSGFLLTHFWFGSVFLINLPIIAIAFISGWFLVPKSKDPEQGKLDPPGAILSIIGISSLVFGLIQAPEQGWAAPQTLTAFAIVFVVLTIFVFWELHTDEPMLDIRFFRDRSFSTGSGGMLLVFLAMYGVMFLMTQYFQLVLGYSPFSAAVRFLPMAPIMIIVAPCTPWLSARFGANRVVGAGMLLIATGFLIFAQVGLHTAYWFILIAIFTLTAGMAMSMSPMTAAIMSAVPQRRAGAGSAMNDATRELGAALGVAVLGSIAASQYTSHLDDALAVIPASAARPRRPPSRARCTRPSSWEVRRGARSPWPRRLPSSTASTSPRTSGSRSAVIAAVLTTRYLPRLPHSRRRVELTGRRDGEHRGARSRRRAPGAGRLAGDELADDGAGVPPGGA